MSDKEFNQLTDQEFDRFLEEMTETPPSPGLADAVNPWRITMNRVLWGVGLTTVTFDALYLDTILPTFGMILMLLGFRALRQENRWFQTAYCLSWLHMGWWFFTLFMDSTVAINDALPTWFLPGGTCLIAACIFLSLLCLRNGIRSVQKKAGLSPHGGTGILIWYLIVICLALVNFSGVSVWGLLIAYFCLLRGLYKLSKELTEAGYSIVSAPVKCNDRIAICAYVTVILGILAIGFGLFAKYPMKWQPVTTAQTSSTEEAQQVREHLQSLGFPAYVLDDMTQEEILACQDATHVLVDVRDYDISQGDAIFTEEELADGIYHGLTDETGERQIRTTYIGIKFADEREHWRILHHFQWLIETEFCGTEAIQLWATDRLDGWFMEGEVSGRLLYDDGTMTYTSPYYDIGPITYEYSGPFASMFGGTSTDIFATFSLPSEGQNHRGYVAYDILERIDGCIVASYFNYVHQKHQSQFPAKTAAEYTMTAWISHNSPFQEIQTGLLFYTHLDEPALID